MEIRKVTDPSFGVYGKVLKGYGFDRMLKEMGHTPVPDDGVIYMASVAAKLKERAYGGLPIQIGYCNGNNHKLNALEYHRSSEIDIAASDLILLLGRQQDIEADYTYDTERAQAYYVPAGTAVELYATTLHYAPCTAQGNGFRCVIVLPKDTNTDLGFKPGKDGEDRLLAARNKWLIAHKEAAIEGAFCGLKGENITL